MTPLGELTALPRFTALPRPSSWILGGLLLRKGRGREEEREGERMGG